MEFLRRYRGAAFALAAILGFALGFGIIANAQTGPQSADAILQLNIGQQARMVAVANELAIANYKQAFANWTRNVDLLKATNQPADAPKPPRVTVFDTAAFTAVFNGYFTRCFENASNGNPCGEFDPSSAFTLQDYPALKLEDPAKPPAQPANPLGVLITDGYYSVAPGDTHPNGYVYTNPIGIKFRKYVIPSPFGGSRWYQAIE